MCVCVLYAHAYRLWVSTHLLVAGQVDNRHFALPPHTGPRPLRAAQEWAYVLREDLYLLEVSNGAGSRDVQFLLRRQR